MSPKAMDFAETHTTTRTEDKVAPDVPWTVVVFDDPVNLMGYVTWVFMKVFGYSESRAAALMLEVHEKGRSLVWSGNREKAELYAQQLQSHQLTASIEKIA